ncbi:MAG: MarR family transcriptional regulator [Clostridiales bacterium]|nr:MarR family transcriptional regulator [Clostridiales bacterium]
MSEAATYEALKIDKQLCFPLYAASRSVIKLYTPLLEELDLTYTQYITLLVLWEKKELNVKQLGQSLYLDSGTLTPLLKKLEKKGLIERRRSREDERNLIVTITERGEALKKEAIRVPEALGGSNHLSKDESQALYGLLYKLLENDD